MLNRTACFLSDNRFPTSPGNASKIREPTFRSIKQPSIQSMCLSCLCCSEIYCSSSTTSRICLWTFSPQLCSVSHILCLKPKSLICKQRRANILEQPRVPTAWRRWPAHVVVFVCESHESGNLSSWITGAIGASGQFSMNRASQSNRAVCMKRDRLL